MNAQGTALVLVYRVNTLGAVVETLPNPKKSPCVNAQVDNSQFPGGCFDVDAPLLEGLLEDTVVEVVSATRPYAQITWADLNEINETSQICEMNWK